MLFYSVIPVAAQKQKDEPLDYRDEVDIHWKVLDDSLKLQAVNKLLVPIQFYLNDKKDDTMQKSFLLRPADSITLAAFARNRPDTILQAGFFDSTRLAYNYGHASLIEPDLDYPYRFPFRKGKKYEVSQGFNGKASHDHDKSRYAIDFQLDVGEPVYAARGGTVVRVIDWFTKQGGEELRNAANRIIILHDDGTIASYVHLDYQGSFVKEGQQVEKGDKIGISGVTGFTRGPHLHFVVRKENDIAIPVYFEGHMGETLKQGKRYKVKD